MDRRKFLGCCGTLAATTTAGCSALDEAIYRTPAFNVFETSDVKMDEAGFIQQYIEVDIGTTVTWENIGTTKHNVEDLPDHEVSEDWDIDKEIDPDETAEHTFEEEGIYDAMCFWHTSERMRIGVGTEIEEPVGTPG